MTVNAVAATSDKEAKATSFKPKLPKSDGTLHVEAFDLPLSAVLDHETRASLLRWIRWSQTVNEHAPGPCTDPDAIPAYRDFLDTSFYPIVIKRSRELYDVDIEPLTMGGVYAEMITPRAQVASKNQNRVLINLHGGGFTVGARSAGQLESIPVAALGRIRVVSVDYRMAPEYRFPAATEDVVAVYEELLTKYAPSNIGIYGCSAGAVLTAQTIAHLHKHGLPLPAAAGMLCAGGSYWGYGDSAHFGAARSGQPLMPMHEHPYFAGADPNDPLLSPMLSREIMAKFPPSLLVGSTRDHVLSTIVHTHLRLVQAGVDASLYVWEGLDHAFFYDPDLPQSREVHEITVKFFDRRLGI